MQEIRFHGRGGQGTVIASKLLAVATAYEGNWVQAFPEFGVERRGAPVTAFLRINRSQIFERYRIYKPHHIVVLGEGWGELGPKNILKKMGRLFQVLYRYHQWFNPFYLNHASALLFNFRNFAVFKAI